MYIITIFNNYSLKVKWSIL